MEAVFENGESAKKRISESQNHLRGVTVQPLTKKRKISSRPLKIEYQLLPPIPWPLPPAPRGEKGNFFCGALQAGYARLQKTFILFSPPNGTGAVGRGQGERQKLTSHKGSSIAV